MATSGIYDGSTLRLYIDDASTDSKKAIGYATVVNTSFSAETVSITHKDNPGGGTWEEITPKTRSGTITCEAYWSQTVIGTSTKIYSTLWDYFENGTKITWAVKTGTTGDYQTVGYGYITQIDGSAPDKEEATFSFTITNSGQARHITIT